MFPVFFSIYLHTMTVQLTLLSSAIFTLMSFQGLTDEFNRNTIGTTFLLGIEAEGVESDIAGEGTKS